MWYNCSHDLYDIITIEIKAGLDEMISVIVYSIQKGDHLKVNICTCYNSNHSNTG